MTSIQFLGGATLRCDGAPLTGPPAQRHRIALLALLAASWPQAVSRDRVQALLWPEHDVASARRLLNLAVHVLRRALGDGAIVSAGDGLLFDPGVADCDLHVFRTAAPDRPAQAIQAWGGTFLAGFHLSDAPDFDYWLEAQRSALGHAYEGVLLAVAARQQSAGDVHARVGTCRRLVAADPYSGGYACTLMRALADAGDVAGALRHAAEHGKRLRADLDIEPAPEVLELAAALQGATPGGSGALGGDRGVHPHVPVIAVVAMGDADDADDADRAEASGIGDGLDADVLSAELRDRMIGGLLRTRTLSVAALHGRGVRLATQASVDRPGIDALVETSVCMVDGVLRMKVRMVDAARGVFLLSRQWDAASASAADLDDVAAGAVEAVAAALTARRREVGTDDVGLEEARLLCLKGQHFCAKRQEASLLRAIDCFERARVLAPDYAPAHTGLASAYAVLGFYDLLPPREAFSLAKRAADAARALNPANAETHASLGYIAKYFDWNWRVAERELQSAIQLDPGAAIGHQWLGNYLVIRARWPEAIAAMDRAVRLAPHSAIATAAAGWAHWHAGEHERALVRYDEAAELDAQLPMAELWRGQTLLSLGRHDEAVAALRRAAELSPTSAAVEACLAYGIAVAGDREGARGLLRRLTARRRSDYVPSYEVAKVHLALGDPARALHWLGLALRERSHSIGFLRADPQLAPLRELPAFGRLLARSGHA
jgi:DNA-binding SARP family transcriptional activator/TolB-like protein